MATRTIDYAAWAKWGFLLGVSLLAFGAGGEIIGHALVGDLPAWENTLFVYAEGTGIAVGFLAPVVFGIVLPLTE